MEYICSHYIFKYTVELQWPEQAWDHENQFQSKVVSI